MYSDYKYIIKTAFSEEVYENIVKRWNEPHRFYHNIDHLNFLVDTFRQMYDNSEITAEEMSTLILVAFFHDVIYDPKRDDNEAKSVDYFRKSCEDGSMKTGFADQVMNMILDTSYRIEPKDKLSKIFWKADNSVLGLPVNKLIEVEHKIFQEFQFAPYDKYRKGRIEFLESSLGMMGKKEDDNLKELIQYVNNRVVRIGVYAGSFNPFHVGHYNILQKARPMFDKVIVAFGNNPEKGKSETVFPSCLDYIHRLEYGGLVTELLDKIEDRGTIVTLIRGIRNGADLSYENNQISFIKDLRPNTNIIFIPADKEYEHVSSTAIRNLKKFDEDAANKYLV